MTGRPPTTRVVGICEPRLPESRCGEEDEVGEARRRGGTAELGCGGCACAEEQVSGARCSAGARGREGSRSEGEVVLVLEAVLVVAALVLEPSRSRVAQPSRPL